MKNISEITDIFAPESNNAIVLNSIVIWYVAILSCREASLMTIVVSGVSYSDKDSIKLDNWSNSFIRSSSSVAWLIGSSLAE